MVRLYVFNNGETTRLCRLSKKLKRLHGPILLLINTDTGQARIAILLPSGLFEIRQPSVSGRLAEIFQYQNNIKQRQARHGFANGKLPLLVHPVGGPHRVPELVLSPLAYLAACLWLGIGGD